MNRDYNHAFTIAQIISGTYLHQDKTDLFVKYLTLWGEATSVQATLDVITYNDILTCTC